MPSGAITSVVSSSRGLTRPADAIAMSRISSRPKNRMLNASRRTKFIASQTKVKKAATGPLRLPWRGWFIAGAPGGAGIGDWGLGIRLHDQRFRQPRIPYPESRLFHRIARPPSRFHSPSVTVATRCPVEEQTGRAHVGTPITNEHLV